MSTTDEIVRLRARWDQVDAWVRDLEQQGQDLTMARLYLVETKAILDFAEGLNMEDVWYEECRYCKALDDDCLHCDGEGYVPHDCG